MSKRIYFGPIKRVGERSDGSYSLSPTQEFQNMWRGKVTGLDSGQFEIEIKRVIRGVNLVLTVAAKVSTRDTLFVNGGVSLALNGTLMLTLGELTELNGVVKEALEVCNSLEAATSLADQANIIMDLKARPASLVTDPT